MLLAAGDVHSPEFFAQFVRSLDRVKEEPELILLAGDMVKKNKIGEMRRVIKAITSRFSSRIISVFGNEEYEEDEEMYIQQNPEVTWLRDEGITLRLGTGRVGIFGTRGSLEEPTWWQKRNIPRIRERYRERVRRVEAGLRELRKASEVLILLSHYAVGFTCVEGEPERIWKQMGSKEMEEVALRSGTDVVVHGHAHGARRLEATVMGMKIYNVAFPARGDILIFEARPRTGTLISFG